MRRFNLGAVLCGACLLGLASLAHSSAASVEQAQHSHTYYVRPDGGSAQQCSGLVDLPYPGSGSGQPCAWNHPFQALPPAAAPRISGGDTLLIAAGSYRMGYGAPGAEHCNSIAAFDCHMPPVPSGPDPAHPTRILGEGWDAGCAAAPELWGAERPWFIVNLTDSSNVELACLEITDHAGCVEFHSGGLACQRNSPPYGDWASIGLYAEDSANVTLRHLNLHGLGWGGVRAGRLRDWTVQDVRIASNGGVGWDGDISGDDSNDGALRFQRVTVEWNGCGESWPELQPIGCWAQSAGGYGDGLGTGATAGHWIIEDSAFLHNTSDGLDLLYARLPGSQVELRRTVSEGNAGDQIKTSGPTSLENVIAVSNCSFFDGQPFTYNVDNCRAGGSALALNPRAGDQSSVVNSTLTGQGDCLVIAECAAGSVCTGAERVLLRNNILLGNPQFSVPGDTTCFTWTDLGDGLFQTDYSLLHGLKNIPLPCPNGSLCAIEPGLASAAIEAFDAHLLASSPTIGQALAASAPADDFAGCPRDAWPDMGAYEQRPRADVNCDGLVDVVDVQMSAAAWGCTGPYACPRSFDQDGDGDVDVADVQRVAGSWGEHDAASAGVP